MISQGRRDYLRLLPLGTVGGKIVVAGLPIRLLGNSLLSKDDHSSGFGSTSRERCPRHTPETGGDRRPGERLLGLLPVPRGDTKHKLESSFFHNVRHRHDLLGARSRNTYWLDQGLLLTRL